MAQAVVIGAGGGIGATLIARLADEGRFERVHALARRAGPGTTGHIDVGEPDSIAAAAAAIDGPVDLVIVATGMLHEGGHGPERALREIDADRLARSFAINAIGPALVLRHFAPLLPRHGRSAIALLSARVGSISDNRSGGWYGYRASKAALNMLVRTAAIEIARTRPEALCVALHPGTVDTALSAPFQGSVAPERLFTPGFAAERLLAVLDALGPAASGRCYGWDGAEIAP